MSWILLILATPILTAAGYFSRLPGLLPFLQILPAYPMMVADLRAGRRARAVGRMLLWAALIGVTVELLAASFPESGAASVFHGAAYRDEMLGWIRTGVGREGNPALFLPQHLLHLVLFLLLSIATGSLLSLFLGAMLMDYMAFYVGSLLAIAQRPDLILLFGWPPWSLIRIAAFVLLGVVLAGPVLRRFARVPFRWEDARVALAVAGAGLVLDLILKTTLAPTWGRILRSALFPL